VAFERRSASIASAGCGRHNHFSHRSIDPSSSIGANQRRTASSHPSVLFYSSAQAMQASGQISIEGPVSMATQTYLGAVAANTRADAILEQ
jgi:hypothetical protein